MLSWLKSAKLADDESRLSEVRQHLDSLRREVEALRRDVDQIRLPALDVLDKVSRRLAGRVNKQLEREEKAAAAEPASTRPRVTVFGRRE